MSWNCTRVISYDQRVGGKWITCDRPLKKIGFWEDIRGVFRLACEEHWLIRKEAV